jgi:hypothetical protein
LALDSPCLCRRWCHVVVDFVCENFLWDVLDGLEALRKSCNVYDVSAMTVPALYVRPCACGVVEGPNRDARN